MIAITGDILRPISNEYRQVGSNKNTEWFDDIISNSYLFKEIFKDQSSLAILNQDKFEEIYRNLNYEITIENWINIISGNISDGKKTDLFKMFDSLFNEEIIVGYEMPDIMLEYFESRNKTYVNFIIHPVRFYKDLILSFRTNNEELKNKIFHYVKNVEHNDLYNKLNIERTKLRRLPDIHILENSCLIVGQTSIDKSLLHNNKMLSLSDFKTKIEGLLNTYNTVYFRKHPYRKYESGLSEFGDRICHFNTHNTYHVMIQPQIRSVYSISSSVCYEARYLNKEAYYFHQYPYKLDDVTTEYEKDRYYSFYPNENLIYGYSEGDLRRSLSLNWAYDIFTKIQEG